MSLIDMGTLELDQKPEAEHVLSPPTPREAKRQKRLILDDLYHYDHVPIKSSTLERAEEFNAALPSEFPTFVKTMVRSNVTTGFWLHLPMPFCKLYMPRHNVTVSLEDESGKEFEVNYIVDKTALSAGWKKFSTAHKLVEGDVVVFQLVRQYVFKVYNFKADNSPGANGAVDLEASIKQVVSENKTNRRAGRPHRNSRTKPVSQSRSLIVFEAEHDNAQDQSEAATDDQLDAIDGIGLLLASSPQLEEPKSNGEFTILVNGRIINSELSETQRAKYRDLCSTQNSFLHEDLLKNISAKLAAEMISETVNIADAIKGSKLSTSQAEYGNWDKTLEGFELLGMKVRFLRTRLHQLSNLCSEIERCRDDENRRASIKEDVKNMKAKLLKLKRRRRKLNSVIESLTGNAETHELLFQEEARAPW